MEKWKHPKHGKYLFLTESTYNDGYPEFIFVDVYTYSKDEPGKLDVVSEVIESRDKLIEAGWVKWVDHSE